MAAKLAQIEVGLAKLQQKVSLLDNASFSKLYADNSLTAVLDGLITDINAIKTLISSGVTQS